ncbi:CBS domain-containing protein [Candidatus Nanohalovita haloferacivicina]|uniref:CBS domain-containing protein n=1 Tax=Candidatus Nanohalovita haloferacivicina TaxID=2978046 RepID=UPI00325FC006|nr:CBS domain containing membrane protein [Candidatus Nanohalobia archaeon BNXNv]
MESVNNITAEKVVNEDPVTVSPDMAVSKIKTRMEENNLRTVPVVDGKDNLKGAVGYRDVIRHIQFNPQSTKVGKVMHEPPRFEEGDSLVELADLRINSGRKMLVLEQGGKLKGKIDDQEFREAFANAKEIEDVNTRTIGSKEVIRVFEEDSIEEARHKMLDNNISRLPVLDENGNMTGMVDSTSILKTIVPKESPSAGGTSGPTGKETKIAGGNQKLKMTDIDVTEVMDRTPLTHEGHMRGDEAIELMNDNDSSEIIITEDDYPVSVVAVKDFIDYVADFQMSDTMLVQITGLEVAEEKAVVHEKIEKAMRGSIGRKVDRPQDMTVRVKKSDKDGKKHRYEFTVKLDCEYGLITAQEEGWEMMDVLDTALGDINTQVRKKKEKQEEHRR